MAYPRPLNSDIDMSMGTVPEGRGTQPMGINGMLVCTFNESHLCSGGRYFAHVEGCRKAYETASLVQGAPVTMLQCPFRSSHYVDANAMRQHIEMCDGYYEWHMLNQTDPPSMVAAENNKDQTVDIGDQGGSVCVGEADEGKILCTLPNDGTDDLVELSSVNGSITADIECLSDGERTSESFFSARESFSDEA